MTSAAKRPRQQSQMRLAGPKNPHSSLLIKIELHVRRRFSARLGGKVWLFAETQKACIKNSRKRFDCGVVSLHGFIEAPALDANSVFGSFELRLQAKEIRIDRKSV